MAINTGLSYISRLDEWRRHEALVLVGMQRSDLREDNNDNYYHKIFGELWP